jgi:hypothetical protein
VFQHDAEREVRRRLSGGEDAFQVIRQLVARGMDRKEASRLVEAVSDELLRAPPLTPLQEPGLLAPLIGGLLAAVVGGGLWTLVVISTESEIGFVAWGIGLLCGLAVLLFARGRRGVPLQVIAACCSVLGIAVGKYGVFYYVARRALAGRAGEEAASALSLFSPEVLTAFFEHLPEVFSGDDLLWVALAVASAWTIPRAVAPKAIPPREEPSADPAPPPGAFTRQ